MTARRNRFKRGLGIPLLVLAFAGPVGRGTGASDERPLSETENHRQQAALARLQGVWEQVGQVDAKGRLEERKPAFFSLSRRYLVVVGPRVYTILSAPGVFKHEDATLHPGGDPRAIDLVDPTSRRTVCGLYDVDGDRLRFCWRVGSRRTLQRPGEIAATRDGFEVLSFRKVSPPDAVAKSRPRLQGADPFVGVWNTVGFETDGVKLEEQKPADPLLDPLRDQRRVCAFHDGILTMFLQSNLGGVQLSHWSYQIDGKKVTFTKPDGAKVSALFEASGDRLSICCSEDGVPRPDQIRTRPEDGRWLLRLERAADAEERAPEAKDR